MLTINSNVAVFIFRCIACNSTNNSTVSLTTLEHISLLLIDQLLRL